MTTLVESFEEVASAADDVVSSQKLNFYYQIPAPLSNQIKKYSFEILFDLNYIQIEIVEP